jgi:hypothetical protein
MLSIFAEIETDLEDTGREIDRLSAQPNPDPAPPIRSAIQRVMARIAADIDRAPLTQRDKLTQRMAEPFRDRPAVISAECRDAIDRLWANPQAQEAVTAFAVFRDEVTTFFIDDEEDDDN